MKKTGFTVIEIMIIIVILLIIGAISVLGLFFRSTRESNAKSAIGSLKAIMNAEVMFKQQVNVAQLYPASRNGLFAAPLLASKYWVLDVSGLNRVAVSGSSAIVLIDFGLAQSDANPAGNTGGPSMPEALTQAPYNLTLAPATIVTAPRRGYRIGVMTTDEEGEVYNGGKGTNSSKFGFCAFPDNYGASGKLCFIIREDGVIWKMAPAEAEEIGSRASADPAYRFTLSSTYNTMSADPTEAGWSRLD